MKIERMLVLLARGLDPFDVHRPMVYGKLKVKAKKFPKFKGGSRVQK